MQILNTFLPLAVFFLAYRFLGIYWATGLLMVAGVIGVAWEWYRHRKVKKLHSVGLALLLVLGSVTLLVQDPVFLYWKFTIYYWLIGVLLIGAPMIGKKPPIQALFELSAAEQSADAQLTLGDRDWRRSNLACGLFFLLIGSVNIYVFSSFTQETWVNFKVFGVTGATIVFFFGLALWISTRPQPSPAEAPEGAADGED